VGYFEILHQTLALKVFDLGSGVDNSLHRPWFIRNGGLRRSGGRAAPPSPKRAAEGPNNGPERPGNKDSKQRPLVSIRHQEHGSEKTADESNKPKPECPQATALQYACNCH
jgi:hypothetical protein